MKFVFTKIIPQSNIMLQNAPFQLYFEKKVCMIKSINVITQHKLGLVERYSFFTLIIFPNMMPLDNILMEKYFIRGIIYTLIQKILIYYKK